MVLTDKNILTFCAASEQVPQRYLDAATELGCRLAQAGARVVNGGGAAGLMRAVTDGALSAGGYVTGVIPQFMVDNGWMHQGLSRHIITADMHERKNVMAQMSSAAVALPGGVGTLEELLEIVTWRQLGLYRHQILLLNVAGYYDHLIAMLRKAALEQFMRQSDLDSILVANTPAEVITLLAASSEVTPLPPAKVQR